MLTRRKKLIALIVLLGVPVLYLVTEHLRGQWSLAAWEREARARGEKLEFEELIPPMPAVSNNGALNFPAVPSLALGSALNVLPSQKFVTPGKMVGILSLKSWPEIFSDESNTSGTNLNWTSAAAELSTNAAVIQRIRAAVRLGQLNFNVNYRGGFSTLLPHLAPLKSSSKLLSASALVELHEGERDAALQSLLDAAALARIQKDEPLLISQLVRIACAVIVLNATWQSLQAPDWTEPQLAQLQHAWEGWRFSDDMLVALTMERAMVRFEFGLCRRDPKRLTDMLENNGSLGLSGNSSAPQGELWDTISTALDPVRSGLRRNVYGPLWSFAWSDQDELRYLRKTQRLLDQARLAAEGQSLAAGKLDSSKPDPQIADFLNQQPKSFRHPVSSLVEGAGILKSVVKAFRADTQREQTVAALALRRHHLRHGKYPASLNELVPDFLSQLPRDFMDGQPLRYRLKDDGTFVLYSVGDDLKDNGGDPNPVDTGAKPSQLDGRDFVWPWPATEEEIAAYITRNTKPPKNQPGR